MSRLARLKELSKSNKVGSAKDRLCSKRKAMMNKCNDRFDMALQLITDLKAGKYDLSDAQTN